MKFIKFLKKKLDEVIWLVKHTPNKIISILIAKWIFVAWWMTVVCTIVLILAWAFTLFDSIQGKALIVDWCEMLKLLWIMENWEL